MHQLMADDARPNLRVWQVCLRMHAHFALCAPGGPRAPMHAAVCNPHTECVSCSPPLHSPPSSFCCS